MAKMVFQWSFIQKDEGRVRRSSSLEPGSLDRLDPGDGREGHRVIFAVKAKEGNLRKVRVKKEDFGFLSIGLLVVALPASADSTITLR